MSFNERLKSLRAERGFTQQQVADHLGITKAAYSGYETGRREPDVFRIKALASLFAVSGDDLLETGFSEPYPAVAFPSPSPTALRIATAYDAAPAAVQDAAYRVLEPYMPKMRVSMAEPATVPLYAVAREGGEVIEEVSPETLAEMKKAHEYFLAHPDNID